jgi:L-phenylalanine/L-methionine N-acetyltransferase
MHTDRREVICWNSSLSAAGDWERCASEVEGSMEIAIRHAELRDSVALQEIHGQIESVMGTLQIPFPTEDAWKKRLESVPEGSVSLVAEVDGKVVGHSVVICHFKSPRRKHVGELGMAVHRDWKRKGVGAALLKALVDLSDNWLGLSRIELTVFVDNEAAVELYRKYNFEIEGAHKKYAFRNGEFVDCYCMARLR